MNLSTPQALPWPALEALVRRDPARRGVASHVQFGTPLCVGHLAAAATDLARRATSVAIATGFCIVDAQPPAAETDGPPGALYLARELTSLGIEVALITDCYAAAPLELGCERLGMPRSLVLAVPLEHVDDAKAGHSPGGLRQYPRADAWVDQYLATRGSRLSHLISIERVGPSHTLRSFLTQRRSGAAPTEEFESLVPNESRNVCHNMRGIPLDSHTAAIHRLFETVVERRLPITTIGMGDGGNEIGMGSIAWETLRSAITVGPAGLVACRVPTDFTLLAGVSDWAAYALALAVQRMRGGRRAAPPGDVAQLRALIEALVHQAGLVDGVTAQGQLSVDGLPLETYLQVFSGIRDVCIAGAS